MWPLTSTTNPY